MTAEVFRVCDEKFESSLKAVVTKLRAEQKLALLQLKELCHDPCMCQIWLRSHWDSLHPPPWIYQSCQILCEFSPLVKIITSFCRACEFLFVDLLISPQKWIYGRRRGKTAAASFLRLHPGTSLRDRSESVSCFVVSGNMLKRNGHFLFHLLLSS